MNLPSYHPNIEYTNQLHSTTNKIICIYPILFTISLKYWLNNINILFIIDIIIGNVLSNKI